jgi:hypothetical protein
MRELGFAVPVCIGLIALIFVLPEPKKLTAIWIAVGIVYALAWHWTLRKLVHGILWLLGSRRLRLL